jgi:tetratricopeptide (TPR) repeat protein
MGQALHKRYKTSGKLDDLEGALHNHQIILDHTLTEDPSRSQCLQRLAVALGDRYLKLGDERDLQNALHKFQEAVDLLPEGHPDRLRYLRNLAVAFTLRYQSFGDLKDLDSAQRSHEAIVEMTAEAPLQNLALRDRYQRLGDLVDLESAVQIFQAAVATSSQGHSDKAAYMQTLAVVFSHRYQRLGDSRDLEAALQNEQQAVDLTPEGHPVILIRLQHLAASFQLRYQRFRDPKDLEAALQIYKEVVRVTVPGHPEKAGRLQGLAECYAHCYQRLQQPEDLHAVHMHYKASLDTPTSTPEQSWRAALNWAAFAEKFQPAESIIAYSSGFRILPEILWVGHTIPVRQNAIRRLGIEQVTSDVAKTCINLFDLRSAVEIMEQGLATTFQQILQLKTDVQGLDRDQAVAFGKLSYELYNSPSGDLRELAEKRDKLLVNIRKQPGLEYFLLPKPYSALQHAAQLGPITILNSHKAGCDGILVIHSATEPLHITFPDVTLEALQSQQNMLRRLLRRCNVRIRGESESTRLFGRQEDFASETTSKCFANMLAWIWTHIVEPVYLVLKSVSDQVFADRFEH